jgi:sterol desaturase/sphingolipid hydroxylase (fatty acid hydroxylase superfamily)
MNLQQTLNWALPTIYTTAIAAEAGLAHRGLLRARYQWRDTLANIAMGWGNFAIGVLMAAVVVAGLTVAYEHRAWDIPASSPWSWAAIFFLDDFIYYWYHRLAHEHRLWWAAHVNHHSSELYNLSTAVRQSWTGLLVGTWLPWVPLALLGFPPWMILMQQTVNLFYQFWIHTEAVDRMPAWFEAVFNTPSHHRVHHAANPRYLDRNYAGILIVWDRLFGTFVAESVHEPVRYGIVKNIHTSNPLRIAMHEWQSIGRDLRAARSVREVLGVTLGPPGWRADGQGETSQRIRDRAAAAAQRIAEV